MVGIPRRSSSPLQSVERDRFQVVRELGSGGIACVYEVIERRQQRRMALKRLHATKSVERRRRMIELFEREFYTLAQIRHPCIVEVYDYGVDEDGPYYTMELLEGSELQTLAPLPYKRACLIARDICSALSLIHSRRLVHRDLNPRNIHCSAHGNAKLIDFGAITMMGPCAQVVGTPAYCPPEVIDSQPLDARADLYALGATLYYALTGRHAFPAKSFAQLRPLWDAPPLPPSAVARDVPPALDRVVLELLSLDPSARPANAGDLMEQFSAIAGCTVDEQLLVAHAYLSTPSLVGRATQLSQVRAHLQRATRGRGSAMLIESASGMGRSRFVAACLLEAKLAGALAVQTAAGQTRDEYGVIRALAASLLETLPELTLRAARETRDVLEQIVPQLRVGTAAPAAFESVKVERAAALAAVVAWFTSIARAQPLLLAIDDVHDTDEPSAACLAYLAREASTAPLLLAVSMNSGARVVAPAALRLYEGHATTVSLPELSSRETEELLRSVFGSVPHLSWIARKFHSIAAGNPRDTMHLAQTLVDQGAAKYRSGAWSLPASHDDSWLPDSMQQALARALETLEPVALRLARLLSLAQDRALRFDECAAMCVDVPVRAVHDALQELLRLQFVKLDDECYMISLSGLHTALQSRADAAQLRADHACLADVFAARPDETFRQAKHLLAATATAAGVDALVAFSVATQTRTDQDPDEYVQLVQSMPNDWLAVFESAIAGCQALDRPRIEVFRLRNRLASLLNVMSAPSGVSHVHLIALIRQLCEDSGLDDYARSDPALPSGQRLQLALSAAKQRYDSSDETVRGLEPGIAIRYVVRSLLLAAGMVAIGIDYALWEALPSIAPLEPLSPAFGLIERLVGAVAARVGGRHDLARVSYTAILERVSQPDLAGLDPSNQRFLRFGVMYGLALIEAGMGLPSSLAWAKTLESEALHAVNALQVRMIFELWSGRVREADQIREQAELRRLQSGRQMADGSHLVWQTIAHAYSDDMTHMKQVLAELQPLAKRHAGWTRVIEYGDGEYHRMRGDLPRALEHVRAALVPDAAGTHQIWPHAAGTHINLLCALERVSEAVSAGDDHLRAAERAELGSLINYIRMPLAVACARDGQHQRALELASEALAEFRANGSGGLSLVLAYETRSRVALHAGQLDDYRAFAALCAEACREMSASALRAKYDRLLWAAKAHALPSAPSTGEPLATSLVETSIKSAFLDCDAQSQRAQRALTLLLAASGVDDGMLYLLGERGLTKVAQVGATNAPHDFASRVQEYLEFELSAHAEVTVSAEAASTSMLTTQVGAFAMILLCHQISDGVVITGVATLSQRPGREFLHPGALAARLSRMLAEAGDVVPQRMP